MENPRSRLTTESSFLSRFNYSRNSLKYLTDFYKEVESRLEAGIGQLENLAERTERGGLNVRKIVLVISNSTDLHADLVCAALQRTGAISYRWNVEETPQHTTCRLQFPQGKGFLEMGGVEVPLDEVTGVYLRASATPEIPPEVEDQSSRQFAEGECKSFVEGVIASLQDCCIVNAPWATREAQLKILQLKLAEELGFSIPKTVITNDPKEARSFVREIGSTIYKTLRTPVIPGKGAVFTHLISAEDLAYLEEGSSYDLQCAPGIFQELVEKKVDVRATVIGREVYACEIHSQEKEATKLDWRRGFAKRSSHLMSDEVQEQCQEMLQRLGLHFGAFDFALTPTGEYVFFEVNPNGSWADVEAVTGLQISRGIAEFLTK